jgi:hypothetical protein
LSVNFSANFCGQRGVAWSARRIPYGRSQFSRPVVDLKPAPNNKDIFHIEYIQQYKIKCEPLRHRRDIAQCADCQRYGHTRNYCHLKLRWVKYAGDPLTTQCHRKERSSDVRCILCGGNYPTNYKDVLYKELQKKHTHHFVETIHASCINQMYPTNSTRNYIC